MSTTITSESNHSRRNSAPGKLGKQDIDPPMAAIELDNTSSKTQMVQGGSSRELSEGNLIEILIGGEDNKENKKGLNHECQPPLNENIEAIHEYIEMFTCLVCS